MIKVPFIPIPGIGGKPADSCIHLSYLIFWLRENGVNNRTHPSQTQIQKKFDRMFPGTVEWNGWKP